MASNFLPVGYIYQLEQSENNNPSRKKVGCRLQNTASHIPFLSVK